VIAHAARGVALAVAVVGCTRGADKNDATGVPTPTRVAPADAATDAGLAFQPFEIEYRSISKHPTCRGNTRIRVDGRGAVYRATNTRDCEPGARWSEPYPAQPIRTLDERALERLARLVLTSGLLDLPAHSTDPKKVTQDGSKQEIEVTLGGKTHLVSIDNVDPAPFAAVRQALIDASAS
jgi:hypothetical protein